MLGIGKDELKIIKQAMQMGQPIPDSIVNAPELSLGLQLYITAFFDLDSERSYGFSTGPIPWTSIKQYAVAFEFDNEQTEDLIYFIKAMDKAYLTRMASQAR